VITLDPPPPVPAAGSSLLYSEEFYALARTRLAAGGILQQWIPMCGYVVRAAARSLQRSFPYVRAFRSYEERGLGHHFLASESPIRVPGVDEFLARLPHKARTDLIEWNTVLATIDEPDLPGFLHALGSQPKEVQDIVASGSDLRTFVERILAQEVPLESLLEGDPRFAITDDRPFNEYYLLRNWLQPSESPAR
jgi:spermidine synthase